jgi:hypothetical protein
MTQENMAADANLTETQSAGDEAAPAKSTTKPEAGTENPDQDQQPERQSEDSPDEGEAADEGAKELQDFSLPEGVEADKEIMGAFKEQAVALGLDQEGAQKLVDLGLQLQNKMLAGFQEQTLVTKDMADKWREETKADKDIGGAKLDKTLAFAGKALDKFFDPDFRKFLDASGLGESPSMVRGFAKIGKMLAEAQPVSGKSQSAPEQSDAKLFFGDMKTD